jgi:glycosyltransferase involved in cell wall biosynthesis
MANVLGLVSYKIFPAKSGGQKNIAVFYKYFCAFHKLICVTIKDNDPSYANYIVLNTLSNSRLRYINVLYFFTLQRIIKSYKVTHLLIEHPYYGWLALLLKKFCRVKFVVHSHNIEASRFKSVGKWWWRIMLRYEKYIHQHADKTFCITEEDRQFMINYYKVNPQKCFVTTYGIEWNQPPGAQQRKEAKRFLQTKYSISQNSVLYFFNGRLDYPPNLEAVKIILNDINPILQSLQYEYKIIICGKNLPMEIQQLNAYNNIIYAGYVDDIDVYFKGTDIFINPIISGGGIKTKLVEALGYNLTSISTITGAIGVDEKLCNGKLLLVNDGNWQRFAIRMKEATLISASVDEKYFEQFCWKNIAKKTAKSMEN